MLSGILLASGVLWFFGAQYLRYLLPVCALATVVGAAGLLEQRDSARAVVPTVAALTALVVGICVTAGAWVASGPPGFPLAAAFGAVSRADYAAAYVPGFRTAEYVARTLPASARLYGVGEARSFYYGRYFVSAFRLGGGISPPLFDAVARARRGRDVQALLREAGFTHLVVYRDHPGIARLRASQVGG